MREEMSSDFQVAFIGIAVLIILIFVISAIYLGKQIYYNEYRFKALNHKLDRIMRAVGALGEGEEKFYSEQDRWALRDEKKRKEEEIATIEREKEAFLKEQEENDS